MVHHKAYKEHERRKTLRRTRDKAGDSEVARREAFQSSAKEFRRAGHFDRNKLRASPSSMAFPSNASSRTYWHSELPPLDAEPMGEHLVEATSGRSPGTLTHRNELWERCYEELMAQARTRLEQEITRLGGDWAHVLNESVESRHDGASGESWLHGSFTYMLYRQPLKR
jgi:hypothetical protein